MNNKSLINHAAGKTELCLYLFMENITKTLSYEEALKKYTATNLGEKSIIEVCQKVK
jgi:hypothetical protein